MYHFESTLLAAITGMGLVSMPQHGLRLFSVYQSEIDKEGKCKICRLADLCNISPSSANKAISFAKQGAIVLKSRGRPKKGLGSSFGLTYEHHMLINQLYLDNPAHTLEDYSITFEYRNSLIDKLL